MRKIKLILLMLTSFMILTQKVKADTFYTNKLGVNLTKEEYEFIEKMYFPGAQDLLNQNDYFKFINSNIIAGDFDYKEYTPMKTFDLTEKDEYRTLKIAKSCSSICYISITSTWTKSPLIASYDVIGAYLENTTLIGDVTTTVTYKNQHSNINNIKKFNNGFGVSFLSSKELPHLINQSFKVTKSGTVYGSHQHANTPISLKSSQDYTIDKSGYGNVFKFGLSSFMTYDGFKGVNISL